MLSRIAKRHRLWLGSPFGLVLLGCVSASTAPPGLGPAVCRVDPRLPGTWQSVRSSSMGRATLRFSFDCECGYTSRVRLALVSLRERGEYWSDGGRLSFSRATGQITSWPMRFAGDRLVLEESPGESHAYRRTRPVRCAERRASMDGADERPVPVAGASGRSRLTSLAFRASTRRRG